MNHMLFCFLFVFFDSMHKIKRPWTGKSLLSLLHIVDDKSLQAVITIELCDRVSTHEAVAFITDDDRIIIISNVGNTNAAQLSGDI